MCCSQWVVVVAAEAAAVADLGSTATGGQGMDVMMTHAHQLWWILS